MTASATRPPWLYHGQQLEGFIEEHNPSLNISKLRLSRNGCQLVGDVLDQIVEKQNIQTGEWEMNLARIHLAVDLQNILKRWCGIGLQKTLEGSALQEFSSGIMPEFGHTVEPETGAGVTKMEITSPPNMFSVLSPRVQHHRLPNGGWPPHNPYISTRAMSAESPPAQTFKRPLENVDHYQESAKVVKTEYVCPYFTRDPLLHPECADKTFPNPRKLKEHVWRFIKPFKCPNCGEGFGREKTKAIHRQQRKTPCIKTDSTYDGSPDHRRDQRIETAKSTLEMIKIFEDYEKDLASNPQGHRIEARSSSSEGSTNGSTETSPERGLDPVVDMFMQLPVNDENHYQSRQSGTLGEYSRPRYGSLNPIPYDNDNQYEVLQRGKSAPPGLSTYPNDFALLDDQKVPEIILTEPEPSRMDQSIYPETWSSSCNWGMDQMEGTSYDFPVGNNTNLMITAHEHHTKALQSEGYGGIKPFHFHMRY